MSAYPATGRELHMSTSAFTTVAGTGRAGDAQDGVAATSGALGEPVGITFDDAGNLYIADSTGKVRMVVHAGQPAAPHTGLALQPTSELQRSLASRHAAMTGMAVMRKD
jgi:hypothetical protein